MRDRKGDDPDGRKVQKSRGRRTPNQDILYGKKSVLNKRKKIKRTKACHLSGSG